MLPRYMHLLIGTFTYLGYPTYNLPIYVSSVKNANSFITICWSKIMFTINMLTKKITLWGGGVMVQDLTP
jgi:hypothetical protein